MTIEEVRDGLKDRRLRVVAEKTGLHYQTVWRIATGNFTTPSFDVINRLGDYLKANP